MSCGRHGHATRWAQVELAKQLWAAALSGALTGAVNGAVSGARGGSGSSQVRIGDAERDSAVAALGEHFVAGRLTKEELDERADAAWSARTSADLAVLFRDLPTLQAPTPPRRRPSQRAHRSWWLAVRLSWVFVLLVVLAAVTEVPWLVVAGFAFLWWTGLFRGLHHWGHRH